MGGITKLQCGFRIKLPDYGKAHGIDRICDLRILLLYHYDKGHSCLLRNHFQSQVIEDVLVFVVAQAYISRKRSNVSELMLDETLLERVTWKA